MLFRIGSPRLAAYLFPFIFLMFFCFWRSFLFPIGVVFWTWLPIVYRPLRLELSPEEEVVASMHMDIIRFNLLLFVVSLVIYHLYVLFFLNPLELQFTNDISEVKQLWWKSTDGALLIFYLIFLGKMGFFWKRIHMPHQGIVLSSELFPSVKTLLLELKVVLVCSVLMSLSDQWSLFKQIYYFTVYSFKYFIYEIRIYYSQYLTCH